MLGFSTKMFVFLPFIHKYSVFSVHLVCLYLKISRFFLRSVKKLVRNARFWYSTSEEKNDHNTNLWIKNYRIGECSFLERQNFQENTKKMKKAFL